MKPSPSTASPAAAGQAGAPASVAQITSSTAQVSPPSILTAPGVTSQTRAPACTWTPRSRRTRMNLAPTRRLCVGRMRAVALNRWNAGMSSARPASPSSRRSACCMARVSSMPAAPAPTTATCSGRDAASTRACSCSQRATRAPIGLTGTPWACAPRDRQRRPRADVYGQYVVRHRRAVAAQHRAAGQVETHRFVVEQAGPGKPRQRLQVDMRVVEAVVPGNQPRQHAGVRRMDVAGHDGHAEARNGIHAQHPEHDGVTVPAAQQDEVLEHGRRLPVHRPLSSPSCTAARSSMRAAPAPNRCGSGSKLTTR